MLDAVLSAAAQMTVTQKAIAVAVAAAAVFALVVALAALVLPARVALALAAGALAVFGLVLALRPVPVGDLGARPAPTADFDAARARFAAAAAADPTPLNPLCPSRLLDHGERTATVVVLLHGVSSCPQAFVDLAPLLHARGHTVLAPRMPFNGYADRATDALSRLTAEALRDWADEAVDVAAGLGDAVIVLGISAGGTAAAWAAQNRPEVARAVVVAPFFGLAGFGPRGNAVLMRAMLTLPNLSMWKDPVRRARWDGMAHAYARQATRGVGEVMRLGYAVFVELARAAPAAGALVVVTNEADRAIDNALAERFAAAAAGWGTPVGRIVFPASDGLGHEIIDPKEPGADPAITYPALLRAIEGPAGAL
jgi:alpha-beta hydrolase superfamily lysophospholipase